MSMERFEVHTDKRRLRRYIRVRTTILVFLSAVQMAGLGMVVGLTSSLDDGLKVPLIGGAAVGAFAFLYGYASALTGPMARMRRRLELDRVLVVDAEGFSMPLTGGWGREIRVPWPAVRDVTARRFFRHHIVSIKLRSGVREDDPGVAGLDRSSLRVAISRGLALGTKFTDSDAEAIQAAIHHFRMPALHR
jgi:hypothetical protein